MLQQKNRQKQTNAGVIIITSGVGESGVYTVELKSINI